MQVLHEHAGFEVYCRLASKYTPVYRELDIKSADAFEQWALMQVRSGEFIQRNA